MEIGHIVTGIISALIAIILVLGAMLKFYLPKMKKNNPGNHEELVEIRRGLQTLNESMSNHAQMSARDHQDVMGGLSRIEEKIK